MTPAFDTAIWPVQKLIPYARNPRKNDAAVARMVSSIKEFGFKIPILCKSDGEVIDGHLRIKAAQEMGIAEVPVILCDEWTPAQVKAFRLLVNRSVTWADWDDELLGLELVDLKSLEYDLALTGFDSDEVAGLLHEAEQSPAGCAEDEVPEPPANPVTALGDLWLLGQHRVLCGDSTSDDTEHLMDRAKADLIFTDPPYGINFQSGMSKGGTSSRFNVLSNDDKVLDIAPVVARMLAHNAAAFIWTSHQVYPLWREQFEDLYKHTIIWHKAGGGIGDLEGNYATDYEMCLFCVNGHPKFRGKRGMAVWPISKDQVMEYRHPTQKPVALARQAIIDFSDYGDLVLDLFGGSGSTLIACQETARNACVMELDSQYVDVIVQRWQTFSGKQATLDGDGRTFDEVKASRHAEA